MLQAQNRNEIIASTQSKNHIYKKLFKRCALITDRQTTIFNVVISSLLGVARFYLVFVAVLRSPLKSNGTKRIFMEQIYFPGSMPLLIPQKALRHVMVSRLLPLPQFILNVLDKTSLEGQ